MEYCLFHSNVKKVLEFECRDLISNAQQADDEVESVIKSRMW